MTQSAVRLSICIPTHDGRGKVFQEAVDSVLAQLTPALRGRVQICISDNASEDGTQALAEHYGRENPGLFLYHRHPTNLGFTQNLMALINIAQGDYCWLLSSDDMMAGQGLLRVLAALDQYPTLAGLTVDLSYYDRSMTRRVREDMSAILLPRTPERAQVFTSPEQIFRECGSVQGGLSMQVFDRKLWLEALEETGEARCADFRLFPYLYLFGKMVRKRPAWLWLPEKLIQSRTDNDYLSEDLNQNALRYQINIMEELYRVWGELFGPSSTTCRSLMHTNFRLFWNGSALLNYKNRYFCTTSDEIRALVMWTRCLFFLPAFWVTAFPVLLTPGFALRAALPALKRTGWVPVLRAWKRQWVQRARGGGVPDAPTP